MNLLESYQNQLAFAFVRTKKLDNVDKYPFGIKNLFPFIIFASAFILLVCTFCSDETVTFEEFTATIYSMATVTINLFNFIILFWKRQQIFQFIDNLELKIEKRKF